LNIHPSTRPPFHLFGQNNICICADRKAISVNHPPGKIDAMWRNQCRLALLKEKFFTFAKRCVMNPEIKNIIINTLSAYDPEMIGVFGSYARNENTVGSDIDILVRFKSTLSLLQLVHVENLISQKLGIKVDLVTEGAVKNKILKESIRQDLQIIFQ